MPIQRRLLATGALAAVIAVSSALAGSPAFGAHRAGSAAAAALCVSSKPGCFATIQAALDAAHDGDVVQVGPGTYPGGLTIERSIKLAGAGVGATVISGGGPVLTIGSIGAASEPTVQISGVAITGGVSRTSPVSIPFVGKAGVFATGGGVEIVPNADFTGGATVTITNSLISSNRAAPTDTVDSGLDCPGGDCPFAFAGGGGIDSWGPLTLINTTVRDNKIGSASGVSDLASDAEGGGILMNRSALTVINSTLSGNECAAAGPNGRFAEAGAIMTFGASMSITNSTLTDNSATLEASLPNSVETLANSGAIHLTDLVATATIVNSTISRNSVTMTNTVGDSVAFSAAVHVDLGVAFTLANSVVAGNSVSSSAAGNAEGDSGVGEMSGTISNTRISGNTVTVHADGGDALAFAGGILAFGSSLNNTDVTGNHLHAIAPAGTAFAAGGGVVADDPGVTLRNSNVNANSADANGARGAARGGGIFDAPIDNGPQGGPLTLQNSSITGNTLNGAAGISVQGGGLSLESNTFSSLHSLIAGNTPDQCLGC
jgi:hypothetical protein